MSALTKNTRIFDGWFAESAAAIRHNDNDWATAGELVGDFVALGFEYNGQKVADLDQDKQRDFRRQLLETLVFFAWGKLLRQQPKAVYTPNLRIRGLDEPSFQLSDFGDKLLRGGAFRRRSYIFGMLVWTLVGAVLKRYKLLISIVTAVAVALRVMEFIESSAMAVVIVIFVFIVAAIIGSVFGSSN